MKILVCGGRNYSDIDEIYRQLDTYLGPPWKQATLVIIQGGATGADYFAKQWAKDRGVRCEQYHADWEKHGNAAGPIRNKWMLEDGKPDLVIAFPGGKGTKNMIEQAIAAKVETIVLAK